MNLLQVSPQHQKNSKRDYLKRNDPVYVGRVVSAMVGHVLAQQTQREKVLFSPTGLHLVSVHDLLWLEGNTVDLVYTPIKFHVQASCT